MVDVEVRGAGVAGCLLAARLRAEGVSVRVVDPRGAWSGASGALLGVVLPVHAEHPWRLEAALGTGRARELLAWAARGIAALPSFDPVGVDWACEGPEAADGERSLAACARMGIPAEATPGGFRLHGGGRVDRAGLRAALDPPVVTTPGPAELLVYATGWTAADPWFHEKLTPVRWQSARFAGPALPRPRVSRQGTVVADGALTLYGARWAEPHLGVGETDPDPAPRVRARLGDLARQDHGVTGAPLAEHAAIVAESCDGLPIVGALPGRPRELALVGLGGFGLTWVGAGVEALVAGILGRPSELPESAAAGRFR